MSASDTIYNTLAESLVKATSWIEQARAIGKRTYLEHGFPTMRNEPWKYTSLKELQRESFNLGQSVTAISSDSENVIEFIDGQLASLPRDLPEGITVQSLEDLNDQDGQHVWPSLEDTSGWDENILAALAQSVLTSGVVINVSGDHASVPLTISHRFESQQIASAPRIIVNVAENASVCIFESIDANNKVIWNLRSMDFNVAKSGRLHFASLGDKGSNSWHTGFLRSRLAENARVNVADFSSGTKLNRRGSHVSIEGQGSHADLLGLSILSGKDVGDNHLEVDHRCADATSRQLYKNILDGESRGVFNGRVRVDTEAFRTDAAQLNKTLLLSDSAEVDAKPELQIDCDDVKCSHGATVGQLNAEELFYFASRGISEGKARNLLCSAFANEVTMEIENDFLREKFGRYVSDSLANTLGIS